MNFHDKQLLIFDLDGTLVDSVPDLAHALNAMLSDLERDNFSIDIIRSWVGNGAKTLVERALSGRGDILKTLDQALCARALDIFLVHYRQRCCVDTILYAGVLQTLKNLHSRGFRLAIVTNKPIEFVAPILNALEIAPYFETILGGDSLAKKKPDPMPLNHLAETLAIEPKHCLMIGDSKNDILAAKSANIDSVGVTYGYNYNESISVYQPELVIERFEQLDTYLLTGESDE